MALGVNRTTRCGTEWQEKKLNLAVCSFLAVIHNWTTEVFLTSEPTVADVSSISLSVQCVSNCCCIVLINKESASMPHSSVMKPILSFFFLFFWLITQNLSLPWGGGETQLNLVQLVVCRLRFRCFQVDETQSSRSTQIHFLPHGTTGTGQFALVVNKHTENCVL